MGHELRTPLNAVIGFSEMLKDQLLGPIGTERYRQYAEDIYASGVHLSQVVDDILEVSKVRARDVELVEEPVDVADCIATMVRLLHVRPDAARRSIEIAVPITLPTLEVDRITRRACSELRGVTSARAPL